MTKNIITVKNVHFSVNLGYTCNIPGEFYVLCNETDTFFDISILIFVKGMFQEVLEEFPEVLMSVDFVGHLIGNRYDKISIGTN